MGNLNWDKIQLEELKKETQLPQVVEEQIEETWLVGYDGTTAGVGIFLPDSDKCVMAVVGESDDQKVTLGSYGTSDEHAALVSHGLEISFQAYLRSFKGDTIVGDPPIGEALKE